ncbi:HAD hydrolase family protein [Olsenella sp. HMSC062G07]|uniref:HAD hydrolase family protein n=1 Tax=Olsenella sp. HMSC062G07 TaxID=1739330 RepID=UPI0008A61B0A|nr:HAD family hydrolase [Olsenella sp. HMSC062G07]OFK24830.1 hypothetical protein HMPREF2826_06315 [Olsenella sp. HMSC062G07]
MIRLVLCDMDGTLVPFGASSPSDRTLRALRSLEKTGVAFGVATGREPVDLLRFFRGDERYLDSGIMSNGKIIQWRGRHLSTIYLDHAILDTLADIAREEEGCALNVYVPRQPREGETFSLSRPCYLGLNDADIRRAVALTGMLPPGDLIDAVPDVPIMSAGFLCLGNGRETAEEQALRMRPLLSEACPQADFLRPTSLFFDVLPRGWSKANAFDRLCEACSIAPEEVVFFGDAENDLAMLGRVPNSFVVANGTDEAKAAARHVIGDAADDAVAKVVEAIARADGRLDLDALDDDALGRMA